MEKILFNHFLTIMPNKLAFVLAKCIRSIFFIHFFLSRTVHQKPIKKSSEELFYSFKQNFA